MSRALLSAHTNPRRASWTPPECKSQVTLVVCAAAQVVSKCNHLRRVQECFWLHGRRSAGRAAARLRAKRSQCGAMGPHGLIKPNMTRRFDRALIRHATRCTMHRSMPCAPSPCRHTVAHFDVPDSLPMQTPEWRGSRTASSRHVHCSPLHMREPLPSRPVLARRFGA